MKYKTLNHQNKIISTSAGKEVYTNRNGTAKGKKKWWKGGKKKKKEEPLKQQCYISFVVLAIHDKQERTLNQQPKKSLYWLTI